MTTEQTVNTGVQMISPEAEKKALRSEFNKAMGVVALIVIIMQTVGIIATIVMLVPVMMEAMTGIDMTNAQEIARVQQEVMASVVSQLKYVFIPTIIGILVGYLIMIPIGCKMLRYRFRDFFGTKCVSGKLIGFGIIVGIAVQMVFSFLASGIAWLMEQVGIQAVTLDTTLDGDIVGAVSMVIAACVCAPIFEEILFRGLVLKALSRKNEWFGIIASSVLFGLYHFNIPQFIAATAMGFVMALVASKAKSLVPSMIIHFALNANGMIQTFILHYAGEDVLDIVVLSETIIFVLATIAIAVFKRDVFLPEKQAPKGNEQVKSFKVLLSSWTLWVYLVIAVILISMTLHAM